MTGAETKIETILSMKTIAVVGLSPNEIRPSHGVARYLLAQGYHIIPVNPGYDEILGLKSYPSLSVVPEPIDIVDVFRRPEQVLPIAEEAVAIGAKALWLQLGIVNDAAVQLAEKAGLLVVQNRCIKIEHQQRHY
ncbi:MAG: CoA-binding protein [Fidelibacterota bacterium]|nr:MAG: CoA-binding protein [Candidatus Neomarinimicrobiota bacterium]